MDSCYKVHTSPNTWDVAVRKCLDLNSKLVDITNSEENVFVTILVAAAGFHRAWIGLSDRRQENLFVWTDGSYYAFTNWGPIEPNGNTSENCVFIDSNNSRWADVACNDSYTSICEKTGWFNVSNFPFFIISYPLDANWHIGHQQDASLSVLGKPYSLIPVKV